MQIDDSIKEDTIKGNLSHEEVQSAHFLNRAMFLKENSDINSIQRINNLISTARIENINNSNSAIKLPEKKSPIKNQKSPSKDSSYLLTPLTIENSKLFHVRNDSGPQSYEVPKVRITSSQIKH
jgi:hypothetical protein